MENKFSMNMFYQWGMQRSTKFRCCVLLLHFNRYFSPKWIQFISLWL